MDREAWEAIAEDLVHAPSRTSPAAPTAGSQTTSETEASMGVTSGACSEPLGGVWTAGSVLPGAGAGEAGDESGKALFVPVMEGMSSYCPRDTQPTREDDAPVDGTPGQGLEDAGEAEERVFEMLGLVIGATLSWKKVGERRWKSLTEWLAGWVGSRGTAVAAVSSSLL